MMKCKRWLLAVLLMMLPLSAMASDISTISIWKDGAFEDLPVPPPPADPETISPGKIHRHASEAEESLLLRAAILAYFEGADMDISSLSYAFNEADLDGGEKEALVLVRGDEIDRSGRPMLLIFSKDRDGFREWEELAGMDYPLIIPKRSKKQESGVHSDLYFLYTDEEGHSSIRRLSPEEGIYPPAVNGETADEKLLKKLKGDAWFCSRDKKGREITWFSLGSE